MAHIFLYKLEQTLVSKNSRLKDIIMCGRFAVVLTEKNLKEQFALEAPIGFTYETYNVAPSQGVPIIYLDKDQKKQLSLMEWGFLPSWAKDHKETLRPINARLETVGNSPMFKQSFQKRRCLIPAIGFYEWSTKTTPKQPYYFYEQANPLFAFAGLWNIWEKEAGIILSFTIITKEAEESVKPIHSRMPFVLNKEYYESWLAEALLPKKSPALTSHAVNLKVNTPKNNDPRLILAMDK
jgi:putative SOS response-associated peptidase YedK